MELASLKFVVDTKQLQDAAAEIAKLAVEVSKLDKPMQNFAKESAKTNKELSKAEDSASRAALAKVKLQQAEEKSATAVGKSTSMLERQNLILEYMAQGNSKGQASILATARAAGALDEDMLALNNTLKTQRSLIGGDPFDKSIGLLQKLQNEYKTTNEVTSLFNRNLGLTEKQMTDLAREKERLIALYGIEGRSLTGLGTEYEQLVQKSLRLNQANDARTKSMRDQVQATNATAKASEYVATEMERATRLTASNGEITSATNNKLIKFEQALKRSGKTASEQAAALTKYKTALGSIEKAGGNRQVDYLSRALGPQITDIAVGLYSGQAPLTVLLQQGGQLRDQFALAGVAGSQMGAMLVQASKAMVSSVKDIGLAVGQLIVNAITGSGSAIVKFGMQITGTSALLDIFRVKLIAISGEGSGLVKAFDLIGKALTFVVGVGAAVAIAALIALAFSVSSLVKEENALNRALNLTGAAMGLNLDMAYDAARGMDEFGVSTGDALKVLTEMAKIGGMSVSSLKMIATTAQALKTAFDIPIADTVKQFKELQEKPTEALTKLAIKLGTIPVEILKQIDAYERAGNAIKAAELATAAYADAGKTAADRTVENFGSITRLGISLGKIWSATWDSIMNIGRRDTLTEELAQVEKNLAFLQGRRGAGTEGSATNNRILATQGLIEDLKNEIAAKKDLAAVEAKNSEAASKFEDDKKKRDEAANKLENEASKIEQSYQQMLQQATSFLLAQIGAVENLTKAEIALAQIRSTDAFKGQSKTRQDAISAIYAEANANEILKRTEDERKRDITLIADLYGKSDNMGDQYYSTLRKLDEALLVGNVSLEEYGKLLNIIYKTSNSFKALESVKITVDKNITDINAERKTLSSSSGMDFKTEAEKASITSLSKFKEASLKADNEYAKNLAEASRTMNQAEYAEAEVLYANLAEVKKAKAQEVYDREQYLLTDGFKRNQAYATAFEDLFKGMGDAIVDFALTGKTSFGDMVKSMLIGLIKLEMQMAMTNMYKAAGGGSGIVAAISSSLGFANGGSFDAGVQKFANGGSFTNSIVDSPTMFKFAKGTGMMGEAGPEAIMPLRRGSDGSLGVVAAGGNSSNVSVQVINNSSSQATTNETTDSKGNRKIEVVIGEMQAGEISRSGSSSQKSIKSTFGIQPQLIRR
jgi:phage-related minor tail protein